MISHKTLRVLFLGMMMVPFLGLGCSRMDGVWPARPGKKVLVSFPPLACFTQKVAGDEANVLCLMTGTGPHDYEIRHDDAMKVRGAHLFLCNGLGLDDFVAQKLVGKAEKKSDMVVKVGDALPHDLLLHVAEGGHHHHHHHGKAEQHGKEKEAEAHEEHDAHVWLSPVLASLMVDEIARALSKADPSHKEGFAKRAADYKAELKELHEYGVKALKNKKSDKIIAHHDSLSYFARDFGLDIVGQVRLQSGLDVGAAERAKLAELTKKHGLVALTFEPQYNKAEVDSLRKTLKSQGVTANLAAVDTLETVTGTSVEPDYYIQVMKKNIDELAKALQ